MTELHPRVKTALLSVHPTSKHPAWHGAPTALGVLRCVRAPVAQYRPYPEANNIRELTLHIAFWENSVANRLSDVTQRVGFTQWKTGWPVREVAVDEAQWKSEVALLKSIHARLVEAVSTFAPDKLDKPARRQTTRNAVEFIHGVGEHNLHHATQIEIIKKLAKHTGVG